MSSANPLQVTPDFPREGKPASVSGYQLKVTVRQVDGRYVEGLTDEELYARYDACLDLVDQLTAYCHRKLAEQPGTSLVTLLPKVRRGVDNKGWDLSVEELDWIMNKVAARMNASG